MKKITFILLFLFVGVFYIYAQQESYTALGFSYQNVFNLSGDSIQSKGGSTGLIGFNFNRYEFRDSRNIGYFVSCDIIGGSIYKSDMIGIANYRSGYIEGIGGLGFRYILGDRTALLGGVGTAFNAHLIEAELLDGELYKDAVANFGLAGQFGLKLDITNTICLKIALNTVYTFVNYMADSQHWAVKSNIGLNPFIGIGVNRYNYFYWGKP